jgi:hypothetical protein
LDSGLGTLFGGYVYPAGKFAAETQFIATVDILDVVKEFVIFDEYSRSYC